MKLRMLELEQFRKFDQAVRLTGFGDRVNVLSGPNEFGKSTILAAIRGLLFERHNSRADPIKRMQTWRGNAAPRLAMEFETGGGVWRVEKRFLSQAMARLTGPDGARFDNDAAEEELQRLLGFGASGKQGAKPENMGVWGALWVTQRDSVVQADFSSGIARSTINSCLDAEVGVLTGTESGQALIRAVREQRAQFLDGNGKPKGRYKEVAAALDAVTSLLADLQARARALADDAAALRTAAAQLARAGDAQSERQDREALDTARQRRERALLHVERVASAEASLSLTRAQRDEAASQQQRRRDCQAAWAAEGEALRTAQESLRAARDDAAAAEKKYAECRARADAATARVTESANARRHWHGVEAAVKRSAALQAHREALRKAQTEEAVAAGLAAKLDTLLVTRTRLDAIRKAAAELDAARALLDAQATELHFSLAPSGIGKVAVGGAVLTEGGWTHAIVDETSVAIDGIGEIRITPSIQNRETLAARIDQAQDRLAASLRAAGCQDLAGAEDRFQAREDIARKLADSQAALARLVPGDAAAGLAPGVAALRSHVVLLEERVNAACDTLGLSSLPALAEAVAQAQTADQAAGEAESALAAARIVSEAAGEQRMQAREAAARLGALVQAHEKEQGRLAREAELAEAREPAEALAARLEQANSVLRQHQDALAALRRDTPAETPEAMEARIMRYEQALTSRQQTGQRLKETIAGLRARIAQEGGFGLDEAIAAAEREREARALELDSIARDLKILNLLLDTLTRAERDTKDRYLAPVVRRVTPYLRSLFPGADIACDDTLRITGMTRGQAGSEDFERLSDGTQEQIAVLSRLAFAEMLIDRGKPAMVILDDALAYADADRMERMFDILTQASMKTQILVLTCREDLFGRLGGNRLELARAAAPAF
jgi:uncharacterized protein YhaN